MLGGNCKHVLLWLHFILFSNQNAKRPLPNYTVEDLERVVTDVKNGTVTTFIVKLRRGTEFLYPSYTIIG